MDPKFAPRAYDLTQASELIRLLRKCRGYLQTCRRQHHGTDFEGRNFAMEAIDKICNGEVGVKLTQTVLAIETREDGVS